MKYAIGVDVGGTKTAYGLFDPDHKLVARYQQPTVVCGTCEDICEAVVDGILNLLKEQNLTLAVALQRLSVKAQESASAADDSERKAVFQ